MSDRKLTDLMTQFLAMDDYPEGGRKTARDMAESFADAFDVDISDPNTKRSQVIFRCAYKAVIRHNAAERAAPEPPL